MKTREMIMIKKRIEIEIKCLKKRKEILESKWGDKENVEIDSAITALEWVVCDVIENLAI